MKSEDVVLGEIRSWAEARDNVRAVILTSSRADPARRPDALSDYDVQVLVRDTEPFVRDDSWLEPFGPIMVRWPLRPGPTSDLGGVTQLALFESGVRIDFQITAATTPQLDVYDHRYRVVVDKDRLADSWPAYDGPETDHAPPTEEQLQDRLNAFWWDIIYVAKGLRRGELNYARDMMESCIRFEKLVPLLSWYVGVTRGWGARIGIHGRWLHLHLDAETWREYTATFADAGMAANWSALMATLALARRVGRTVSAGLGYAHRDERDRKVTEYIDGIRRLEKLEG